MGEDVGYLRSRVPFPPIVMGILSVSCAIIVREITEYGFTKKKEIISTRDESEEI